MSRQVNENTLKRRTKPPLLDTPTLGPPRDPYDSLSLSRLLHPDTLSSRTLEPHSRVALSSCTAEALVPNFLEHAVGKTCSLSKVRLSLLLCESFLSRDVRPPIRCARASSLQPRVCLEAALVGFPRVTCVT